MSLAETTVDRLQLRKLQQLADAADAWQTAHHEAVARAKNHTERMAELDRAVDAANRNTERERTRAETTEHRVAVLVTICRDALSTGGRTATGFEIDHDDAIAIKRCLINLGVHPDLLPPTHPDEP